MTDSPTYDVVVLGFGAEPHLADCLSAIDRDAPASVRLVLVDNGVPGLHDASIVVPARTEVVGSGRNLGFAGGCNLGAESTTADVVVFLNSDAIVSPGSLNRLVEVAAEPSVGIASGCLRLADRPHLVNSAGNPVHFSGITWAGGFGDDASEHASRGSVPSASGGFFAVRRKVWNQLGGFDPDYFAYHEDVDLSLRVWMSGATVELVPTATAMHHYEFARNQTKMYLLERNRFITVLCDYPAPVLAAVLPMLLLLDLPLLSLAATQGWFMQALFARWWVLRHLPQLCHRRARVQAGLVVPAAVVADQLCGRIEPPMVGSPPGMALLNSALEWYWARMVVAIRRQAQGRRI